MKNDRRESTEPSLLWIVRHPKKFTSKQRRKANTWVDSDGVTHFENRSSAETITALESLEKMAKDRDVIGMAAITLRPDGRYDLVVSGNAFDDNLRASGIVKQLNDVLSSLSTDDEEESA